VSLFLVGLLLSCSEEKKENIKVGDQAPVFSVIDLDGNTVSLSDYQGSPVVLRFFLLDCKYCRADTPVFNDYYSRFFEKGLRVLYVDTLGTDVRELHVFKKELAIVFPVARDTEGEVAAGYRVKALPQTVILDPQHRIIAAIFGGVSEAELKSLLSPYLLLD
jgi:peroxiredoxin